MVKSLLTGANRVALLVPDYQPFANITFRPNRKVQGKLLSISKGSEILFYSLLETKLTCEEFLLHAWYASLYSIWFVPFTAWDWSDGDIILHKPCLAADIEIGLWMGENNQ